MILTKLEHVSSVPSQWQMYLDDGSTLYVGENELLHYALYPGMVLTESAWEEIKAAACQTAVRTKALTLLSQRPMSRQELLQKLTARPHGKKQADPVSPALAQSTADWLEELGYLNDAEYAKTVARHYITTGHGRYKVQCELSRRGVSREYWEDALAEAPSPEDGIDTFLQRRLKGRKPDPKDIKRVSDALARRGYRWDEIRDGLNRYGAELDEQDENAGYP